jgi:glycosyltransferase involved in cell wall biosynthesis
MFSKRVKNLRIVDQRYHNSARSKGKQHFKDVLFINGCDPKIVPHPVRYRVDHQIEQLEAKNIRADQIFYTDLTLDKVRYYRTFIFFRCPSTPLIKEFIPAAKKLNKTVAFDIDDLVIDTKYTNQIEYVANVMPPDEKVLYDDGVNRMKETLMLCDYATTTTETLRRELQNYVPKVFINRNVASLEMLELSETARTKTKSETAKVKIGYFSGSITHNENFELVEPAILEILEKFPNVELNVVGILDAQNRLLQKYPNQVKSLGWVDWRELPGKIAEVDVNIAPLVDSIFNRAKSENKWVEAALVKVPTVASNLGAFAEVIEDGVTGMLASTKEEWVTALEKLVQDASLRHRIGETAFEHCCKACVTGFSGRNVQEIVKVNRKSNYFFMLPGNVQSGGIMVALNHAKILQEAGNDVSMINPYVENIPEDDHVFITFEGTRFPQIDANEYQIDGRLDNVVATMWPTLLQLEQYVNRGKGYYLVQHFEPGFMKMSDPDYMRALRTYSPTADVEFVTVSQWIKKWLKDDFEVESKLIPNGINLHNFYQRDTSRSLTNLGHATPSREGGDGETSESAGSRRGETSPRKVKVLIEGDPDSPHKNVSEAFEIANGLDRENYEIHFVSYYAKPDWGARIDAAHIAVPYEKMPKIYRECDILLKTSVFESFSYPPLEMMATGGLVVCLKNDGNAEYLEDGVNCLFYERGNLEHARRQIERLVKEPELRAKLLENGVKTAQERSWDTLKSTVLEVYRPVDPNPSLPLKVPGSSSTSSN